MAAGIDGEEQPQRAQVGDQPRARLRRPLARIGIADLDVAGAADRLDAWLADGRHGAMEYMQRHAAIRRDATRLLPGARRAIVARMDYVPRGTLPGWLDAVDGYLWARENTRLARLLTGTSYMCRNRNNADGGFTSEHGFANALDIVGFTLANGRVINVESDWLPMSAPEGRLLRQAPQARARPAADRA